MVSYNSNKWESGFKLDIPEFKGCLQPEEFLDWIAAVEEILEFKECERPRPRPVLCMLGQTHMNGWSRIIASQNGGSTSYIFPLRLGVLQWSRHLFNYLDK